MDTLHSQVVPHVHAYLIEGWWDVLSDSFKQLPAACFGAEEVRLLPFLADTLGIDDIRRVTDLETRVSAQPDVFVLGCRTMTREAQNAFLKAVEEPTARTYFFIIVPFERVLLPTLRSRLLKLSYVKRGATDKVFVEVFLKARTNERFKLLETMIQDKDVASAHMFLDILLEQLYRSGETPEALGEILQARQALTRKGSSLKLLLEHIALVTPVNTV